MFRVCLCFCVCVGVWVGGGGGMWVGACAFVLMTE